jgi:capsular polysaccharide transport system permease protein
MSSTSWGEPRVGGGEPAPAVVGRTLAGFRNQLRVVHALLLREMQTRFGGRPLGFAWLFLEPLIYAGMMAALRGLTGFGMSVPGVSVFVFALVSYLPFFTFRAIVSRAPQLRGSLRLLYHTPIKLIDVVLARHALEAAAVVTVMAVLVFGVSFWGNAPPSSIPILTLGLVLLFLYSHGLGMLAGAASAKWEISGRIIQPLLFLSLPLSGAIIALNNLDPAIREVLLWNPQVHVHEMMREGFFGEKLPSFYDVGYVSAWVAAVNLLGLAALRAVRPSLTL